MPQPDLGPAARRLATLVTAVADDALGRPTPCPDYSVGDLIEHVGGLALGFLAAATKAPVEGAPSTPSGDSARLGDDWRERIARDLDRMAAAWNEPEAWTGMTTAGGVDLPGEVAGIVALDELVVHAWDLARSTGQAYSCGDADLEAVLMFLVPMADRGAPPPDGPFGPPVPVPPDAPLLDRVVGLTGRDPGWSPS